MTEENKKSLMKKTKSELIDIIARKDDTEKQYSSDIKSMENDFHDLSDKYDNLTNDHKSTIDTLTKTNNELNKLREENEKYDRSLAEISQDYTGAIMTRNIALTIAVVAVIGLIIMMF